MDEIKKIRIKNCKGFAEEGLEIELFNCSYKKPNIFVAKNGFGKSTITKAFEYTVNKNLMEKDNLDFLLEIKTKDSVSTQILKTTATTNEIKEQYLIKTIHSSLKVSPAGMYGSGNLTVDTINFGKVHNQNNFIYSLDTKLENYRKYCIPKTQFNQLIKEEILWKRLDEDYNYIKKVFENKKEEILLSEFLVILDSNSSKNFVEVEYKKNLEQRIESNENIKQLLNIIEDCIIFKYSFEKIILIIQLKYFFCENNIKKRTISNEYKALHQKNFIKSTNQLIKAINCSSHSLSIKKIKGMYSFKFPQISKMSNGERDLLNFVTRLKKFEYDLEKNNKDSILIIDEVFDYLDSSNLLSALYYFNNFFKMQKEKNRCVFVIIMTHLDPKVFNYFNFKHKVHYLENFEIKKDNKFSDVIIERENGQDKEVLDKYYFHYINDVYTEPLSSKLKYLEMNNLEFKQFLYKELKRYIKGEKFEPLKIILGTRILIEEYLYSCMEDEFEKNEFISTHKTAKKVEFCEHNNINFDEDIRFLQPIINEGLHLKNKNGLENIYSKLAFMLNNKVIPQVISNILNKIGE